MTPTLQPGDQLTVDPKAEVRVGDIVVAKHPFKKSVTMVKRVKDIDEGRYYLISDNPEDSSDSRSFGAISQNELIGKVISRL